ncbi:hypothetical protein [Methylocystis silviterrae]|uniref:hypothetical protein n=1 Tax=Methylocystis silviterrae TaxID=2743612 RepID=UPI003C76539C
MNLLWIPDQASGLSGMTAASANLFADEPHGGKETIAQRTKHGKPFTYDAPRRGIFGGSGGVEAVGRA